MTFGSCFAGVGGFDLGFERAGLECRWQVENEPYCIRVLERHWPRVARFGDVREFAGDRRERFVDIICGGSPCQDLSVAGQRAGLAGSRSGLFFEFIRIIREMRAASDGKYPMFAVFENVPGLFSSDRGIDFAMVLRSFRECGALDIAWRVLDARFFGVPQRRRRVFVVCDFIAHRAGSVLFDTQSMPRRSSSMQETKADIAHCIDGRTGGVSAKENQETLIPSITSRIGKGGFTDPVNDGIIACTIPASDGGVSSGFHPIVAEAMPIQSPGACHGIQGRGYRDPGSQMYTIDSHEHGIAYRSPSLPVGNRTVPGVSEALDMCEICIKGPDSPRYKAIGNAVVPAVSYWLAARIAGVIGKGERDSV